MAVGSTLTPDPKSRRIDSHAMAKRTQAPAKKTSTVAAARRGGGGGGQNTSQPVGRWLWENFKSLAGAVAIYLIVKTRFIEASRIPSGSMIPTLLVGDWLFVNKLAYGPTIPFPKPHLPGDTNPHTHE